MKKIMSIFGAVLLSCFVFAETNANDTQAAIVNSLLIQQMMNNMQQQNNQQNQNQNTEEKSKKRRAVEDEDDLMDLGYKRFSLGEAEDNFVFKARNNYEYEIDLWAVNKRGKLSYYGSILIAGKKGYKGNPLDADLDEYRCVWMKILNDDNAIIKALGAKHDDQYFEIQ